jgi:hypothetical protein
MIYLASPYSHTDPAVMQARHDAVCRAAARLMDKGHKVFSPIAHSHAIAVAGGLARGWEFWQEIDFEWIRMCGAVWVLCLDGWLESKGVAAELRYAQAMQLPVTLIDPATVAGCLDAPRDAEAPQANYRVPGLPRTKGATA